MITIRAAKSDGRGDGRVMGEMTGVMKTATFLCIKAFWKVEGRDDLLEA
jgi:hypothetical protein